ncbi:hypothetical protein NLM24_34445 [Nocardia zapadnayensis]|uniref:hypothetical protein n=1 Tax=Nocardia rhamnosiphila TaxID=426716 RepID=UPI002246F963|nr:hypothetical protein [Nocardia zapadnayensis]MCX0275690.1 hypothetical protein [Nocardia zapadnayensis]
MSTRMTKIFAATAIALSLGAPVASAATPSATPITGSAIILCIPLGSATVCI